MNIRTMSVLGTLALLSACYSAEELRQRPVVWTAVYPAAFDDMVTCLSSPRSGVMVTPQIYKKDQRAHITSAIMPNGTIASDFEIKALGEHSTEVKWRHVTGVEGSNRHADRDARERADACGKSA